MAPLASQIALSKSKATFLHKKMNALNDTKTSELSKSAKETGNICDRLRHFVMTWIKSSFLNANRDVMWGRLARKFCPRVAILLHF